MPSEHRSGRGANSTHGNLQPELFRVRQAQIVHFFSSSPRVDLSERVNYMNCLHSLLRLTSGVYNMNKQEDNIGLVGGWEADTI